MGETIRFRPTWRQYQWWLLLYPLSQVAAALGVGLPSPFWPVTAVLCVVIVAESFWIMTLGVDLRPDALVMRGVRTRMIPWRDITWIGPAPLFGTKTVGIMYAGGPPRVVRLRAPQHLPVLMPDPGFEAKARTIYDTWVRATSRGSAP